MEGLELLVCKRVPPPSSVRSMLEPASGSNSEEVGLLTWGGHRSSPFFFLTTNGRRSKSREPQFNCRVDFAVGHPHWHIAGAEPRQNTRGHWYGDTRTGALR